MNFVMFGYFVGTSYFGELTDIDIKKLMFEQRMQEIDNDLVPFGFYDNGLDDAPKEPIINAWGFEDDWDRPKF
jgi:hypothetical protein